MILDKAQIIKLVQLDLTPVDAKNLSRIETALAGALEEMGLRLHTANMLKSYTETVTAGDREITLYGENQDLYSLFALKMGTGADERVLTYREKLKFIHDHDSSSATADLPTIFTILGSTDGKPNVKFDCPASATETLTVYYFPDMSSENLAMARSATALATGTVAYFKGRNTPEGLPYYEQFKELTQLARGSQEMFDRQYYELHLNKEDASIRSVVKTIQTRRQ